MARMSRRGALIGLGLGVAVTGLGCGGMNPFLLPYFFDHDTKAPAEFALAPHPRKSDVKVVAFVSARTGLQPDLAGVDRMLNAELIAALDANIKGNEEKTQVLKMPKIDEYKSQNPNWRAAHPAEMGKSVAEGTDYVIDVEIQDIDLYKPGSRGQWLQGHATVSVNAYDLTKPIKDPVYKFERTFEFPREGEIEKTSAAMLSTFRMKFIQYIAGELAAKFTATPTQRDRMANATWITP
jgi:hypothetical protein